MLIEYQRYTKNKQNNNKFKIFQYYCHASLSSATPTCSGYDDDTRP